ncbi:hypothetical protein NDU88_003299 [Pleurodeles waltl]|uniref:Uncharacterized protein n=1 Tax=Pleurodeles waltl TaxID=8319 RepID=A0AAV7MT20_PLEWA|nr:hypothetical protein NDU88_003299 [Pleurodeles waltl]
MALCLHFRNFYQCLIRARDCSRSYRVNSRDETREEERGVRHTTLVDAGAGWLASRLLTTSARCASGTRFAAAAASRCLQTAAENSSGSRKSRVSCFCGGRSRGLLLRSEVHGPGAVAAGSGRAVSVSFREQAGVTRTAACFFTSASGGPQLRRFAVTVRTTAWSGHKEKPEARSQKEHQRSTGVPESLSPRAPEHQSTRGAPEEYQRGTRGAPEESLGLPPYPATIWTRVEKVEQGASELENRQVKEQE